MFTQKISSNKLAILITLIIICVSLSGRVFSNEVNNSSFENNSGLPNCSWIPHSFKSSLADNWVGWNVSGNTSDYFHTSSGNIVCINFTPSPRTGSAHVGFAYGSSQSSQYLYREFVQTQTASLTAGTTYDINFYVKRAAGSVTGNIGIYFSQSPVSSIYGLTPNISQNITFTSGYQLISGNFTPPVSGQYYITIGCFTTGNIVSLNYFFVDDVSVDERPFADLMIRDDINDLGVEPNNTAGVFYASTDIWVRRQNDASTVHQNPLYRDPGLLQPNYVKVRVKNAGNLQGSGTVKLYYAKGSTNLQWPLKWVNYFIGSLPFGDYLSSQTVSNLPGGQEIILTFPWYPPNPDDYIPYGVETTHWCLLARIETSPAPPYGMTYSENSDINYNTKYNNNIAWKNLTVMGPLHHGDNTLRGSVSVWGNNGNRASKFRLFMPDKEKFLEMGTVNVVLSENLYNKWVEGGMMGKSVRNTGRNTISIIDYDAYINNIFLEEAEIGTITVEMRSEKYSDKQEYTFFVEQYDEMDEDIFVGGEMFIINEESFADKGEDRKQTGIKNKFNFNNYPNPFNPSTQISFFLAADSKVSVKVYDVTGQLVAVLINNELRTPGVHSVLFDGSDLASGIYFYRLEAGDFSETKKMLLVK
jgi:hypothetical protein